MTAPTTAPSAGPAMGPSIASLTRRLQDTPGDFLAEPEINGRGMVAVPAVVSDLFVAYDAPMLDTTAGATFHPFDSDVNRNWLRCVLIACWLLHDPWFVAARPVDGAWALLSSGLGELSLALAAPLLVSDDDRREELARRCLHALGLVPDGETEAQATDRLTTLDSVERARVLAETAYAEVRAAAVREAMHEKAAAEAAAKATRE